MRKSLRITTIAAALIIGIAAAPALYAQSDGNTAATPTTPMGQNSMPMGQNNMPMSQGKTPMGQGNMGQGNMGQGNMGQGKMPMGQGNMPMGQGKMMGMMKQMMKTHTDMMKQMMEQHTQSDSDDKILKPDLRGKRSGGCRAAEQVTP